MMIDVNLVLENGKTKPATINPDYIVYMVRYTNCTCIEFVTGKSYRVEEKPADILKLASGTVGSDDRLKKNARKGKEKG